MLRDWIFFTCRRMDRGEAGEPCRDRGMEKLIFTEDEKNSVKEFCNQYLRLYNDYHIYKILFEENSHKELLIKTANTFFGDFNRIIIAHLFVQFCRLTDREGKEGKYNLTTKYLIKNIQWPSDTEKTLNAIHNKLQTFRSFIICARNKILAHIDLDTTRSKGMLGEFPKGEDIEFLNSLGEFCDCMHRNCFGIPFGDVDPGGEGDVLDLIKTLKRSLAFEKLWTESSGEDLIKLDKLLESVTVSLNHKNCAPPG